MKNSNFTLIALVFIIALGILGFNSAEKPVPSYEWKQIATLESVVGAGLGRSSVIETVKGETNVLNDYELKNFFSAAGINFGNVQTNEKTIVQLISDTESDGWELFSITSTALNTDTKRQGIFLTRHLFRRQIN